jgi:hypothetical protein
MSKKDDLKEEGKLIEENTEKTKDRLEFDQAINALLKDRKNYTEEERVELAKLSAYNAEIAQLHGKSTEAHKEKVELAKQLVKMGAMAWNDDHAGITKSQKLLLERAKALGLNIEQLKEWLEVNKLVNLEMDAGERKGKSFFGGIASSLGMSADLSSTFYGQLKEISSTLAKGGKAADGMKKAFAETFTIENAMHGMTMAILQATIQLAFAADRAGAAFAKATGAGRALQTEITSVGQGYRNLGITMEMAGEAATQMYSKYPGFMKLSKAERENTMKTAAMLNKLGVAYEDQATMLTHYTKVHKMTNTEVQSLMKTMALEAEGLQMTMAEYSKGFTEANKTLAVYGRNAPKIFRKIAAQAQAAGTSTSKLLDIASKFDTFSDAAETTGKLNAILGTQMSAMDLLSMSEEKRIETLITSMQAQGMAFKDMDRFTQKAIAQTLGITDLAEAQRILGMSVGEYRSLNRSAMAAAKEQAALAKKMKAAMDVMEKLKMLFAEMAIKLGPIITYFAEFVQVILDFVHGLGDGTKKFLAMTMGIFAFGRMLMFLFPILKLVGLIGMPFMSTGMKLMGKAGKKSAKHVAKFGAALMLTSVAMLITAIAIAIIVLSIAVLVWQLANLAENGWEAMLVLLAFAVVIWALNLAFTALGSNPITVGGALLIMGIVLALAWLVSGLASLTENLSAGFNALGLFLANITKIDKAVTAIEKLAAAFGSLNWALQGGFAGLFGGPSPIEKMMEDIQPLLDKADALAVVFGALQSLGEVDLAAQFSAAAAGMGEIAAVLDSEKGVHVTHTLENLALITTGTSAQMKTGGMLKGLTSSVSGLTDIFKEKMKMSVQLDKDQTRKFLEGIAVDVDLHR